MKKSLIVILCFVSAPVWGQIPVRFLVQDYCRDSLVNADFEEVYEGEKRYFKTPLSKESDGTYLFEEGKEYSVHLLITRGEEWYWDRSFLYRPTKHSRDTILSAHTISKLKQTNFALGPERDYDRFFRCGELCEGYCVDYYRNGKIRLEGNFTEGFPVGDLKIYDEKGYLKRIDKYDELVKFERSTFPYHTVYGNLIYERLVYDENGNLMVRKTFGDDPRWQYIRVLKSVTFYDKNGNIIKEYLSSDGSLGWPLDGAFLKESEEL